MLLILFFSFLFIPNSFASTTILEEPQLGGHTTLTLPYASEEGIFNEMSGISIPKKELLNKDLLEDFLENCKLECIFDEDPAFADKVISDSKSSSYEKSLYALAEGWCGDPLTLSYFEGIEKGISTAFDRCDMKRLLAFRIKLEEEIYS